MSALDSLYQEVILDHSKRPRNFRAMENCSNKADGYNPLCGDRVTVYVKVNEEGKVEDVSFQGSGCAISTASASILTETLKGKTKAEAEALFETFHSLVTGHAGEGEDEDLGKLAVFSGVSEFPARVKCATLSWHTMRAALSEGSEPISTE